MKLSAVVIAAFGLAACEPVDGSTSAMPNTTTAPESVQAIAAPYQDLTAVRWNPDDGCYWYRHVGPVETTMLPLRTVNGNPICTKPAA
ncbi:hypothetical protein Q4604_04015 [Marinovum sp. 1_MG-2023]|nr:hypothetical protein [Marinovum sp. 1_MG-2023]